MRCMFYRLARVVVVTLTVAFSAGALANGQEFFGDGQVKPDLYYYGRIKDTEGNILDNAVITVTYKAANLRFPFRNDSPGHFRSPDIGRAIKGLGHPLDIDQIEVVCRKKGYTQVKATVTPGKTGDRIGIEFVMRADSSGAVAAN